MAKDTYYFSHDYNARNDKKISALVREFKSSGYGIFWATCEMMHEEGGTLEFDELTLDAIAKDINEESDYVKQVLDKCVEKYKLFTKQDILLQSNRIHRNLETKNEKKAIKAEAGRLGGIKSGESRRNNNLLKQNEAVLQPASSNEPNESKVNESKVNESKVNEINKGLNNGTWESEKRLFLNAEEWQMKQCTEFKLSKPQLIDSINIFLKELDNKEDYKDVKELKKHWYGWYKFNSNKKIIPILEKGNKNSFV